MLFKYKKLLFLFIAIFFSKSYAESFNFSYPVLEKTQQVKVLRTAPNTFVVNPHASQQLKIVTTSWPPYIGPELCKQGWVFQLAAALFNEIGYGFTIDYLPWARAVRLAELGQADILYPEYYIEPSAPSDVVAYKYRLDNLALSLPFVGGELGFITRAGYKSKYTGDMNSIKGAKIGVVRGYQNTPEFDQYLDINFFEAFQARDDQQNLKLLHSGRVDYIVGDFLVIDYLQKTFNKQLNKKIKRLSPPLKNNDLYFAVAKSNKNWRAIKQKIDAQLKLFEKSNTLNKIKTANRLECQKNYE